MGPDPHSDFHFRLIPYLIKERNQIINIKRILKMYEKVQIKKMI